MQKPHTLFLRSSLFPVDNRCVAVPYEFALFLGRPAVYDSYSSLLLVCVTLSTCTQRSTMYSAMNPEWPDATLGLPLSHSLSWVSKAGRWAQVAKMRMQFASLAITRVASYPCSPPGFWAEAGLGQKCRVTLLFDSFNGHSRSKMEGGDPGKTRRAVKRLHWSCAFVCLACIQADAERVTASVEAISSQIQNNSSDKPKPKQSLLSRQVGIQCRDDYNEAPPTARASFSTPDVSTRLI
jgi:hypothetical protein